MGNKVRGMLLGLVPMQIRLIVRVRRWMRDGSDIELLLLPLMKNTGSFVDIGANRGSWAGPASRIFSEVHAFEPNVQLFRALKLLAPANMKVYRTALSDRSGTATFSVPVLDGHQVDTRGSLNSDANPGMAEETITVTTATLDSLKLRNVDVIKIDVEGHEEATLKGAMETVRRERPCLIVEIEERHHLGRSETIIGDLMAAGYAVFFMRGTRIERFQPGTITALQVPGEETQEGQEKLDSYINNFIFVPSEKGRLVDDIAGFAAPH